MRVFTSCYICRGPDSSRPVSEAIIKLQNVTQKTTADNTTLISDGTEAKKVRQQGGKSADTLAGVTGEGTSSKLLQFGKQGDDTLEASGGSGKSSVKQRAGQGNDTISLLLAEGKLRAAIKNMIDAGVQ